MKFQTKLLRFDAAPGDPYMPAVTPIYQTATFHQPSAEGGGTHDYSRSGNPTRDVLASQLARLESGRHGFAFATGMAAIDAVVSLIPAGGSVIAGDDLYGGTFRYLTRLAPTRGLAVSFVDTSSLPALEAAVAAAARPTLVLIETPTNPAMAITDLRKTADIVHRHGGLLAVDSSLMSPYLQRPLTHGADIVIHSATKLLSGHGHVSAGAAVVANDDLAARIGWHQNAVGSALGPFDAWLLLSGIKTLAVRLDRQQATAARLATRLADHHAVAEVFYPTLDGHPGRALHLEQAAGGGVVLTVRLASRRAARHLVEATQLFPIAVSFGGVGSSIEIPVAMSHAPLRDRHGPPTIDDTWVRISIGLEDPDDLEADLLAALELPIRVRSARSGSGTARPG